MGDAPQTHFDLLVNRGLSLGEIAANGGVSAPDLHRRVLGALDSSGKRGVRLGAMTKRQNRRLRARGREQSFDLFLNYRLPVELRVPERCHCVVQSADSGGPPA